MIAFTLQWCYFPASGYRTRDTGVFGPSVGGHVWSSSSYGLCVVQACFLGFEARYVEPFRIETRSWSLSVRCVQELTILYKEGTILARSIVE